MIRKIIIDVLVIGGGGAACRAAVAANDCGASVLMVLKGKLGLSGATNYQFSELAGITMADGLNPDDSQEIFYNDIITAGAGMADPEVVQTLVENAPRVKKELEKWGINFERDEQGHFLQIQGCFASRPRGYLVKHHGTLIVKALITQIKLRNIKYMEDSVILSLITKGNKVVGALGLDAQNDLFIIEAKAVVMAAGGSVRIFEYNVNPWDVSGDSYSMAFRAGVKQCNLEFMQSGVGYMYPQIGAFFSYVWEGLPKLYNKNGEHFLPKYLPKGITEEMVMKKHAHHFPFSTADISKYIDIAVKKEISEGNATEHGGIIIDFKHFTPEYVNSVSYTMQNMWPRTLEFYRSIGMDFLNDQIELSIFGHAINGGIKIDKKGMSSMEGLFAAGENAAGAHGADRLGGTMMLNTQVFGRICGEESAKYALANKTVSVPEKDAISQGAFALEMIHRNPDIKQLYRQLQIESSKDYLLVKTETSLNHFLSVLDNLETEIIASEYTDSISRETMALENEITAARLMTLSARERRESRGSHFREDYPTMNNNEFGRVIFRY